ncbi:thioredoxin family protein [Sulfurovum riftiae]|uniref:Thioredoxin domain-containing protein n=1 Tax=Sulfurovum riftiae TaxID=1630136 RepID=A0A151CGV2_9BACT|nr:thioredoxin family protein [Sulfurovum riftiae]KYJ86775.1 hypothetical protein AS592_08080 [Sulfurovum riftiae]
MLPQPIKLLFLCLLPLLASANHVHWLGSYDCALQKAHDTHKPLLVLVVSKDSPTSNTIIKNVLMDQKYVDIINEKMVAVIVTYEGSENYPIEMYYTTVFPTLFFIDAQKELFLQKPLYGNGISRENVEKAVKTL